MAAGARCPPFGMTDPAGGKDVYCIYKPLWGKHEPDVGPLNMKLDTCLHCDSVEFVWCAIQLFRSVDISATLLPL